MPTHMGVKGLRLYWVIVIIHVIILPCSSLFLYFTFFLFLFLHIALFQLSTRCLDIITNINGIFCLKLKAQKEPVSLSQHHETS